MALQPPSLLAQMPQPLGNAAQGKVRFAEIHGVHGSKKRKRYEIAAAIDGEAVNLYNVCASLQVVVGSMLIALF